MYACVCYEQSLRMRRSSSSLIRHQRALIVRDWVKMSVHNFLKLKKHLQWITHANHLLKIAIHGDVCIQIFAMIQIYCDRHDAFRASLLTIKGT